MVETPNNTESYDLDMVKHNKNNTDYYVTWHIRLPRSNEECIQQVNITEADYKLLLEKFN